MLRYPRYSMNEPTIIPYHQRFGFRIIRKPFTEEQKIISGNYDQDYDRQRSSNRVDSLMWRN